MFSPPAKLTELRWGNIPYPWHKDRAFRHDEMTSTCTSHCSKAVKCLLQIIFRMAPERHVILERHIMFNIRLCANSPNPSSISIDNPAANLSPRN